MASLPVLSASKILVIDDEPDLRTLYELTLLREGHQVDTAASVQEALEALARQTYDLVITDMRLPDGMGIDILKNLRLQFRGERCMVITAYGSAENAVESLKAGAFDYLTKPVDLKQFRTAVASALSDSRGLDAATTSAKAVASVAASSTAASALELMAGSSVAMLAVKERIAKVARSMAPVLIRGESGTGKELAARALHANSHRAQGPWVAVNCSAIPEALLEAEFFGAKKGAYTGATQDRTGFFQAAHGGTLFLDEIGDLPLAMQAKLLRAIQERKIRPLGSNAEEAVDVRLVSATHKDLAAEVAANTFRQDLYYRLNVIDIHLPPLRERKDDLEALCRAILQRICAETGSPVPAISASMLEQLKLHPLKGNVRELENLLHRAMALSDGFALEMDATYADSTPAVLLPTQEPAVANSAIADIQAQTDVMNELATAPAPLAIPNDLQSHLDAQERDILVRVLTETRFNRTAAAQRLGISLRQIRYRMERLRIDVPGEDRDKTP
ncbi:Transcriptional regulatory protein ZraR [Curvibacter sp. AEP1-3]|uniref:sigma-54-dependent transcriptional regulator n=1 Tax=Curvibacter sp. AEP1-3 TaxID=1844971 RepID=UPI000B3C545B|nr:sigma-54 dependent transcriptional regulator [Curvibacter sp. AEP1-3]ARV20146.1 Transcriptional regulatory protein ZraR [Curvibacter sp. AEP1-3]